VIAATNREILRLVDDGKFRQDLFYRLNVVTFNLPPLRERKNDIPLLFEYFLKYFAESAGRSAIKINYDAMQLMKNYSYPGNVRELKNIAERISIYIDGDSVSSQEIQRFLPLATSREVESLKDAVDHFEVEYINNIISLCAGNMTEAARRLGIERSHLYKKLKKHES
jgi:two-component system nitrogen regulation response regulator NtrX